MSAIPARFSATMRASIAILALALLALAPTGSNAHDDFGEDDDFATVEDDDDGGDTVVNVETVKENEVVYITPEMHKDAYFAEHFDDPEAVMDKKWIRKVENIGIVFVRGAEITRNVRNAY